jgi:hypothetical protein
VERRRWARREALRRPFRKIREFLFRKP